MEAHKVAVVILNWNGEHFLKKFLPSVVRYSSGEGIAVYVADNGSTDSSLALLQSSFPEVRTICLDKNYGFAGGYNIALRQINTEYFVLLNSDVEVVENWLQPLVEFMDSNPKAAACAPKLLDYNNQKKFEYAGAAGGFIDCLGYPFCRGRILSKIETDEGQYDTTTEIFWASGACLFVRAKYFAEVGELDQRFFAHMEEIDLCWRFHNFGYSVWCVPQSKVFHVGGGTLPNNNPHKLFLNYRNSLYMLYKNLNGPALFITILERLILDGVSAAAYLLQFKFKFFWAVFSAHFAFYSSIKWLNSTRKRIPKAPRRSIKTLYPKSILIDFFICKNKIYSKLRIINIPFL